MIRVLAGTLTGWALGVAIYHAVPAIGPFLGVGLGWLLAGAGGFAAAATFR